MNSPFEWFILLRPQNECPRSQNQFQDPRFAALPAWQWITSVKLAASRNQINPSLQKLPTGDVFLIRM